MLNKVKTSIKTKVIAKITTLIAIILLFLFGFIINDNIASLRQKASLELQHKAKLFSSTLEKNIEHLKESTELLGRNELIVNAFIDQEARNEYLMSLINNFKTGKFLSTLSIVDFEGRLIFQNNKKKSLLGYTQRLQLALNLSQSIIYFDDSNNNIVVIVPVEYYETTQGAIIASFDFKKVAASSYTSEVDIYKKISKNSHTYYEENYSSSEKYFVYKLTQNMKNSLLENMGLKVEVGIVEDTYLAPVNSQINLLLVLGLFSLLLGIFVSYSVARDITNPILKLFKKIDTSSSSNFVDQYEPLETDDELEGLGYAFHQKEKELHELNKNLQLRVDDAIKELEKNELLKKNILATIPDLVWLKNLSGVYLTCNPEFERFFGAKESEIVGKTDYDFVSKELADFFTEHDKKAMNSEVALINEEWVTYATDGSNILLETTKEKLRDVDGSVIGVLGIGHNITQRYELQKELEEEKNRFVLAIDGTKDGLWDWNLKTDELFFNERFETMLGYDAGSLTKHMSTFYGLLHPDDTEYVKRVVQEYFDTKGKGFYEVPFRLRTKNGTWRWLLGRGKAEFDKDGEPTKLVGFNTDITDQREFQAKLDHIAKHDSLTHLPNRFLLSELLTHAMHNAARQNKQLALLFIDLDGFKEINDTHGHDAGDKVLSVVASRMKKVVRASDIVSRIGGDEFIVVITNLNESNEAMPLIQKCLIDISKEIQYKDSTMHVSASIGISFYPQANDIGNEILIRQADQAMYEAKTTGKNKYKIFNIEASDEIKERQKLVSEVYNAITKNEFILYYQPKVNMQNSKVVGVEALLRWNHPEKGFLYPDSFLPLIETQSDLMCEIGKWVLHSAFSQLDQWHKLEYDINMNINVSAHEIQQEDFPSYIETLFSKFPSIKPNTIEIEILETASFDNFEATAQILQECQKLGISIAIDDFGTGYASLHYLKKLPMDTIKIDRSFIMDLLYKSSSLSIMEGSIGLAKAFNTNIVAEGVESEEHGKILLQFGCNLAQGYIISKSIPAQDIIAWIDSYKGFESWVNVKPISQNERLILYASIKHSGWVYKVEEYLNKKTTYLPQLDESKCYLGKWLQNTALKHYDNNPIYDELKALHVEIHDYVESLLLSNDQDKSKEISKIKGLNEQILLKLSQLTSVSTV